MRFKPESEHGANNGLNVARDYMEKIKQEFPWCVPPLSAHAAISPGLELKLCRLTHCRISYGDLWTLGGVCAIQEAQGPKVPWRPARIDGFEKDVTPDGRLPDASQAQDHLRNIFYRMGWVREWDAPGTISVADGSWFAAVASTTRRSSLFPVLTAWVDATLVSDCADSSAALSEPVLMAIQRAVDRSGFDGPWTFSPTTFTNDYFKLLFEEKWNWKKWAGPAQFEDTKTKSLMMLP
jgi:cytochrome c peroxidase